MRFPARERVNVVAVMQGHDLWEVLVLVVVAMAIAGCGTITFKRGASPSAMEADERRCRSIASDDEGYIECLKDHGWMATDARRSLDDSGSRGPVSRERATQSEPEAARRAGAQRDGLPGDEVREASAAPLQVGDPADTPAVAASDESVADPRDSVAVSSWWKIGGTPAALDRAVKSCSDELGPDHKPNVAVTLVTRAFKKCLAEAGWHAAGEQRVDHLP